MQQLLGAQLFPATTEQPTTVFTFGLIREFHIHSLESKAIVYGYIGGLWHLTNNTFMTDVPVSVEFASWSQLPTDFRGIGFAISVPPNCPCMEVYCHAKAEWTAPWGWPCLCH